MPKPPIQIPRSQTVPTDCHCCGHKNVLSEQSVETMILIRRKETICQAPKMVCKNCEATFATIEQADRGVEAAITTYQAEHGLLTAAEIIEKRNRHQLTQKELADESQVSLASIKRFESGRHVQDPSNDMAIRSAFENYSFFTLRDFVVVQQTPSIERISMIYTHETSFLGRNPQLAELSKTEVDMRLPIWGISDEPLLSPCHA